MTVPGSCGPRWEIAGGRPDEAETVAVAVALQALIMVPAGDPAPPAWLRAARAEGVGGPPMRSPVDLDAISWR